MRYFIFPLFLLPYLGWGQSPITYHLGLDNIQHHELVVTIDFSSLDETPLVLHMPTASPGRYAAHNFAKNVYDVSATGAQGQSLSVYRQDMDTWVIAGHQGAARVRYTLFANRGDGTYSKVDNRKLHLNMPATFMFAEGLGHLPVHLTWNPSERPAWSVATQLEQIDERTFRAPDIYYFFDSPTFFGDIDFIRWTTISEDREYTIELAMMHEGTDQQLEDYAQWVKAIVEEQKAVFGSLPDFDFGRYTFLCAYNPWVSGDGMEHRNSTICSSTGNLERNAESLIGTISHEFFHCWNVERIRPADLEPFDFTHTNMSDGLWFAEGFTSYYDDLILARAGIRTLEQYVTGLTGTLNYVLNSPGRSHRNPLEMSRQAPFVDAATSIDPNNNRNVFISYYSYGAVLGLALDLEIRYRFPGKSLDDVMRYLWEHFGRPEIPYSIPDLEYALATVIDDPDFARRIFSDYIYEGGMPDIPDLLARFGVRMDLARPGTSDLLGLQVEKIEESGWRLNAPISENHSLYIAGLNQGDVITHLDGRILEDAEHLQNLAIGSEHSIYYVQNGLQEKGSFRVKADPTWALTMVEDPDISTLKRRDNWLTAQGGQ